MVVVQSNVLLRLFHHLTPKVYIYQLQAMIQLPNALFGELNIESSRVFIHNGDVLLVAMIVLRQTIVSKRNRLAYHIQFRQACYSGASRR